MPVEWRDVEHLTCFQDKVLTCGLGKVGVQGQVWMLNVHLTGVWQKLKTKEILPQEAGLDESSTTTNLILIKRIKVL